MNKRKLTDTEKILRYQKKLIKLQKTMFSMEDSSDNESIETEEIIVEEVDPEVEVDVQDTTQHEAPTAEPEKPASPNLDGVSIGNPILPDKEGGEKENIPELDPDLLTALGDATDDSPKYGEKIHHNLAERWDPLLKKGLSKEAKEKLLKNYLVPENCVLLQAPKLNPEISAAIPDLVRNRDKKIAASQQQLVGTGITAVNRGLSILLTSGDKLLAIKHVSDACRILTDLHFMETVIRSKLVSAGLSKQFLQVIQDSERDETLFGDKLSEKIKASKAIEKQSLQIKKTGTKNIAVPSTSTAPRAGFHNQGNWTAPPRFPSNRGGRGGPRRPLTAQRRLPPTPQTRPAGQFKPRAMQQ